MGRPPYGFTMEDGVIVRASTFSSVRECLSLYCEWDKHDWSVVRLRYNGLDLRPSMRQVTDRMIKSYPNDGWTLKRKHSIISRWKSTERLENWNG